MTNFKQLGLSENLLKAINELGFNSPTDIQQQAIPKLIKDDRDFIGLAQTGTGKTAAFGLPLLERIDPAMKATQALILAPTRELGQQIAEQLDIYSKYQEKLNVLAVYGGASITNQMRALKRTQHAIIATPGRLLDLIKRRAVNLESVRFLVLDEADEMLNMGFKEDLDLILSYTPEEKLTWLFSATMPKEIKKIVNKYMDNPTEVRINSKEQVNVDIEHQYALVKASDKAEALSRILDISPDMRGVVFCRTKNETQELAELLLRQNYKADSLHGDLSQAQRDRVMRRFKKHELHVLIATDVAARGIDVNDLTHVIHYTLPDDNSYYTHRSGRTARAGKKGISLAFVSGREKHRIRKLESQLGIEFDRAFIPNANDIAEIRVEDWCMKVLNKGTAGKVTKKLNQKANDIFFRLSKEELIEKLLVIELEKIKSDSEKDLNDTESRGYSEGKGGGGSRSGRRRGGGGGKGGKKSFGNFNKKGGGGKGGKKAHTRRKR
ncbi:MAG: DEAD/DEAH box helicase [Candidatus Kapaibacterium sp.]|nr:DEAD/DEAH box helicase [Ignavibacteriota bacterium]MCB9222182.1 DEAD/DEAH box helicase [Ignavibacteria bacterium]